MIIDKSKMTDEMARGLLCCALEGGSNYWYMIEDYDLPPGTKVKDFDAGGFKAKEMGVENWHYHQYLIPFAEGGAIIFSVKEFVDDSTEGKTYRFDRAAMEKAWDLMRIDQPRHWADAISENDDADTGDVFLQLALFGEVVYG